ncbi:tetratricopeptide repeat protein [Parabacteroides distasonis]|uniref:Tetratricopeptide repeat protein n=1 Tax=Parabacteroides distasonis TaxID=823 RepID=A0A9Q4MSV0_PARDI|nr:tetratricopeptide repeat protein [Parabacteroides distasonis]MRY64362.1 tetratricopeptide repeat protein [Parabacteroides distasonis]MRY72104.1 tetratricopeptide repeat protein [Parabacteroides distasonis]MRY81239.1 tetratricopeptide repeat protein [Parabacteroides distasonis]MRZ15833.1 tetratricopeptide repeat protein [Parabacteroides distasonis]MRZ18689.1 tetratricopeptide repeat protein [Parabacteroides distasonis]
MKRILIPLCLVVGSHMASGQRSYQFDAPNRLFVEGKELFSLKNYSGCIDKLEAYKQHSTDADLIQEADYMLVYSAYEQGRPNAVELLKDYLDVYPASRHADEVNFLIGSAHFGQGEYQKAIFWFNESNIDMLSPEQQEAYCFRLAYSLLQIGDMEKARGYFARIEQIGTKYREASTYYVAYIDYATGKYNNALVEFTRLKDLPDYKERSLYYITQIYFIQNKYEKVISEGKELLASYPDSENNSEVYRIMGNAYYHLGNEDQAINMLSKYVSSTDSPLRGDLYILGVCYYNKGNYSSAVNALGRTVRENDALSQNAYLYLGQSYLKLKDKNNARMAFEAAATSSFDKQVKEAAMYNYALLIHETAFTGFGESVTIFEDFLNDFPNSKYADKVNDYLVEVYLTTKNYQAALNSIDKIKHPSTKILEAKQDILFQLGTQAFTNMELDKAVDLFSRAISLGAYKLESRNDAYFWRGESYYRQGEYNKAISDYRTYLNNTRQRNTDMYALAHYNLGYSYFKLKEYGEALNRFRQYVNLESNQQTPAYADAYNRIGDCLFHNRQFAMAEENYTRAAQLQPSAGDYSVYQKGFLLGLQKDYKGKISVMDRLIREFPESQYVDDALFEKGRSYVLLDNNQAAAASFEQLMRDFPQSSLARKAGVQLGLIYFNDNQPEKAADAYKSVISNYPGSEEAKVALQDLKSVYIELNDINSFAAYANSLGGNVRFEVSEQDSLTYLAAEKLFMRGDNEGARRSLTNYLQTFPQGAFSSNANFYLASIAFAKKDLEEAKRLFSLVLESGDTKFREESWARKAEIEYLDKDYAAAMESFKHLQAVAENPENKEAAKLGLMRCAELIGQPQEALLAANDLLKEPKLSPEIMSEARYVRAKAYISLKQENKALADLKEISKDTRTIHGAEAKYLLAQLYYDNKDDKNAETVLMNFIENGTPHQYWLARGFILLADIYIRQGDDFQARQYLTSLQNNYKGDDEIAAMIEDRLGKLKK